MGGCGDVGSLEPWSPDIFAQIKLVMSAKWSPGMKQLISRAPILPFWDPGDLHFLNWSPGFLNHFTSLCRFGSHLNDHT